MKTFSLSELAILPLLSASLLCVSAISPGRAGAEPLSGVKNIVLHTRAGKEIVIGKAALTPEGERSRFKLSFDDKKFSQYPADGAAGERSARGRRQGSSFRPVWMGIARVVAVARGARGGRRRFAADHLRDLPGRRPRQVLSAAFDLRGNPQQPLTVSIRRSEASARQQTAPRVLDESPAFWAMTRGEWRASALYRYVILTILRATSLLS